MAKHKGAPKGIVRNRLGKNQYVGAAGLGELNKRITLRVEPDIWQPLSEMPAGQRSECIRRWIREGLQRDGQVA
ncbi:MAG: hypothetical protein KME26_15295 [Oscillatoria princeps RMCB-10]|jgi:hypothetical protein|nr:hypothetical protein [Oscillatoria princeps RMCB-10]